MNLATLLLALALPVWSERAREPVMLDFTAQWCGPCRQMRPAVDQLVRNGYPVKAVDIDDNPELAERYQVKSVPTFVIIDPESGQELARTSGAQPASQLAGVFQEARSKFVESVPNAEPRGEAREEVAPAPAPTSPNPKPWETVVRIKVHGQGAIGFGSGTIIHSSPTESIILTCAHIFKLEGRTQAPPSRFPRKITIDLFDGKLSGYRPAQVHYTNETHEGEAIDYDFTRDVGLIRIRPGRRLPFARVVPEHWQPKARMRMTTVGCSEGHDATAWSTVILNPLMKGLQGNGAYEAIECEIAPKQGRSGGGLFTDDGYVAGVCDFAEPRGNRGLYATPSSIYQILDRNRLMALYAPADSTPGGSGTLVAGNPARRSGSSQPIANEVEIARLQSPEPLGDRNAGANRGRGSVSLPPPELLGIKPPVLVSRSNPESKPSTRRSSWHPKDTLTAELRMDPTLDSDRFAFDEERPPAPRVLDSPEPDREETRDHDDMVSLPDREVRSPRTNRSAWKPVRSPLPSLEIGHSR